MIALHRPHRLWPLVVALAAGGGARAAGAQVGTTTDIITGTVTGPDSQPLAGAVVVATSLETRVSRQRTTDAHGRFTIVFPDGGGRYELTARFIGMAPAQVSVARQADEDRIEASIRMGLFAVPLEPITVSARSSARSDGAGPGSSARSFDPERLARLPINASDLNTVATLQPGVLGIRESDSTATAFSVAGQRPTANNITLDGLSFGSGSVPQDAVRSIRVVTNAYDVARGQFSGGLIASTTRGGTNVPQGSFTYALRDRSFAWGEATASPFGQGATQNQLGGGVGGPIVPTRLFVFAAPHGPARGLALPATGGTRTTRGGGLMASLTSYFGGRFINELRGYVARQRREARAFLALPSALVNVASALPNGGQGIATLTFGGNGGLPQHSDNRSLEIADEFSWLPGPTAHRLKVGVDVIGTRLEESQTPNQFGTFIFPSLAALAAGSPATFTRTLVPQVHPGTAWNSAVYAGDTWRAGGGLQLTYGARLEAAHFSGAPPYNHAVDSLFGVRTDRIPSELHFSPRVGFTWALGGGSGGGGPQTTFLRGGVGDFRSLTPTSLYAAALGAPGLATAETQLICVGSAAPTPDWSQYTQDASTIPSQCADTAAAVTVTPHPNVTAFAPDFTAPRARRATLALVQRFGRSNYWVTLEGSYARGLSQYGFRDLNLITTPRFTLSDEAGRPVYVPADSIVPTTGAISATGSRLHPEFGSVLLVGSDLQSDTKQLTLTVTGATSWGAAFRLGYTLTRAQDQSSFSCCSAASGFASATTGGNPDAREWSRSSLERRHAFVGTATLPITRALDLSAIGSFTSGAPFTPIVGSDINGDGAKNDRAFIFNPGLTADTAIARGMQALLATAPSAIRGCLGRQLGGIAARNSCTGPWQAALDLQLNWRPTWFGLDRRLTLSLLTVNLLGGLDEWLHGAANLRGWGYAAAPDPVLLYVRGFDPTTAQFHYAVNGRFGATASASGGVTAPFQIALQGRLAIGPGTTRRSLRGARQSALDPPAPTLPGNPITAILGLRDSLGCTLDQPAQLRAIADSLDARNRLLPASLDAGAQLAATRHNARWALERARAVLTLAQWSKLADALKSREAALPN